MVKQVVRCSVCMRVHDVTELRDKKQLVNGSVTFTCPFKMTVGNYRIENLGTMAHEEVGILITSFKTLRLWGRGVPEPSDSDAGYVEV
jgi:hypothetical protein